MDNEILLPFDGSEGTEKALHRAVSIALWAEAAIHVLFVADTTRHSVTVLENQVGDALVQQDLKVFGHSITGGLNHCEGE